MGRDEVKEGLDLWPVQKTCVSFFGRVMSRLELFKSVTLLKWERKLLYGSLDN